MRFDHYTPPRRLSGFGTSQLAAPVFVTQMQRLQAAAPHNNFDIGGWLADTLVGAIPKVAGGLFGPEAGAVVSLGLGAFTGYARAPTRAPSIAPLLSLGDAILPEDAAGGVRRLFRAPPRRRFMTRRPTVQAAPGGLFALPAGIPLATPQSVAVVNQTQIQSGSLLDQLFSAVG